jgi:hypothetical protein
VRIALREHLFSRSFILLIPKGVKIEVLFVFYCIIMF